MKQKNVSLNLGLFIFSLIFVNQAAVASPISLIPTNPAEPNIDSIANIELGDVTLNVQEIQAESIFRILLKVTETSTHMIQYLSPGTYKFREGQYHISIFKAKPDTNDPMQTYQIIEDSFVIKKDKPVYKNYPKPKRRKAATHYSIFSLGASVSKISDKYEVANPAKEHLDHFKVTNSLSDQVDYEQSGFKNGLFSGISSYAAYTLANEKWIIDGGFDLLANTWLIRPSIFAGAGRYWTSQNLITWITGGGVVESAIWNNVKINSGLGSSTGSRNADDVGLYLQFGISKKTGGWFVSGKYHPINKSSFLTLGWNFGGEQIDYDVPSVTKF